MSLRSALPRALLALALLAGAGEAFATSLLRTIANQAGREIMRGLMGGLSRRR